LYYIVEKVECRSFLMNSFIDLRGQGGECGVCMQIGVIGCDVSNMFFISLF